MNQLKTEALKLVQIYKYAIFIFSKNKATTIAAASTFFFLITIIPFILLFIRVLGLFLDDITLGTDQILEFLNDFFPHIQIGLINSAKVYISKYLFAQTSSSFFNSAVLLLSSFTFFNSVWNGLYIITQSKRKISLINHLKGLVIICVSVLFIIMTLVIPSVIYYLHQFINWSLVSSSLWKNFSFLHSFILYFQSLDYQLLLFFKSNLFHGVLLLIYFSFFFKFIFFEKIRWGSAFNGSFIFVIGMLILKYLFHLYLYYVRGSYILHYGDYYSFFAALIWLYFAMCILFFGICVTYANNNSLLVKNRYRES